MPCAKQQAEQKKKKKRVPFSAVGCILCISRCFINFSFIEIKNNLSSTTVFQILLLKFLNYTQQKIKQFTYDL